MSARWLLTTVTCLLAGLLLLAIAVCSLTPSPNMREMRWIPDWLGTWADRNGNFRNFPVFAALAALLFPVFSALPSSFYSSLKLKFQPFSFRTALRAAVCASALGVLLEVAQLLFLPKRHFDWGDIGWSTSGAFVGPFACAFCVALTLRSP